MAKTKWTDYAITIIVFFLIWMLIGIGSNARGIVIYDDFPAKPFYPTSAYTITVKNNSPTINPVIVPLYLVMIQTDNVSCTLLWKDTPDCNARTWDVGKIDSGGESSFPLILSPRTQNFTISVFVYLNLWNAVRIPCGSRTFYFEYLLNNTYLAQGA
jgi:hypothetical protein